MIWVFFVNTSVSMNRLFSGKLTYLECAKVGIERLLKIESAVGRQNNKYVLVTCDDRPDCYKSIAGIDSQSALLDSLKNLTATDLPKAGLGFAAIFGYLDCLLHRQYLESIGKGLYPGNIEMVTIMWFTDGEKYVKPYQNIWKVTEELHIPSHRLPVRDLYNEPFRWNQILNTIHMVPEGEKVNPKLREMSDAMGGLYMRVNSLSNLISSIEGYISPSRITHVSLTEGTTVILLDLKELSPPERVLIHSNKSHQSLFPIPESYFTDNLPLNPLTMATDIPKRATPPVIYYSKAEKEFVVPRDFPVDCLNVSLPSKFAKALLAAQHGYLLYINPREKIPFGILSSSNKLPFMYLMPYNFPELFSILSEKSLELSRKTFLNYLNSIPSYYKEPLSKALRAANLDSIWPQEVSKTTDRKITDYIQHLMDAASNELALIHKSQAKKKLKTSEKSQNKAITELTRSELIPSLFGMQEIFVGSLSSEKLRKLLSLSSETKDPHEIPIIKMGDYGTKIEKQEILRNPYDDEETAKLKERNIFGNRYSKLSKTFKIDEQDGVDEKQLIEERPANNAKPLARTPSLARTPNLPALCTWWVQGPLPFVPVPSWSEIKKHAPNERDYVKSYYTKLLANAAFEYAAEPNSENSAQSEALPETKNNAQAEISLVQKSALQTNFDSLQSEDIYDIKLKFCQNLRAYPNKYLEQEAINSLEAILRAQIPPESRKSLLEHLEFLACRFNRTSLRAAVQNLK